MRHAAILLLALFSLGGCGRMLGFETDYVLREPVTVRFADGGEPVTIPAGTRVKQTFSKGDVAFVEVYGTASSGQLRQSGDEQ